MFLLFEVVRFVPPIEACSSNQDQRAVPESNYNVSTQLLRDRVTALLRYCGIAESRCRFTAAEIGLGSLLASPAP
jgi:hypothetical protein